MKAEEKEINHGWYGRRFVQFELVRLMKRRHLSFSFKPADQKAPTMVKYLPAYSVDTFVYTWHKMKFGDLPNLKLYRDLAFWRQMENFTFDLGSEERDKQARVWRNAFSSNAVSSDLFFDIDAPKIDKAYDQAKKLKQLLDDSKVPYWMQFSGSKGFHFYIPGECLPVMSIHSRLAENKKVVMNIKQKLRLKHIDTAVLDNEPARIAKLPYSVDGSTGLVVFPLSSLDFDMFNKEKMHPVDILSKFKIMQRGIMLHNADNTDAAQKFVKLWSKRK